MPDMGPRIDIFADILEFLRIQIDSDVIFDNPTDTNKIRIANH